jgi:hypothetical protein
MMKMMKKMKKNKERLPEVFLTYFDAYYES